MLIYNGRCSVVSGSFRFAHKKIRCGAPPTTKKGRRRCWLQRSRHRHRAFFGKYLQWKLSLRWWIYDCAVSAEQFFCDCFWSPCEWTCRRRASTPPPYTRATRSFRCLWHDLVVIIVVLDAQHDATLDHPLIGLPSTRALVLLWCSLCNLLVVLVVALPARTSYDRNITTSALRSITKHITYRAQQTLHTTINNQIQKGKLTT